MGAQLRQIRQRIKSIKSTAKITRAQELIASSRVGKARDRAFAAGPYAREIAKAASILVSHNLAVNHALLNRRPDTSRVAVVLMTSDRGFCGGYNNNVIRQAQALTELLRGEGKQPEYYVIGSKGVDWFRFRDREMAGQWAGMTGQPDYATAAEVGQRLIDAFDMPTRDGGVGEVHVIYTEFVSMLNQRTTVHRILPMEIEEAPEGGEGTALPPYEFEPSAREVLDEMLRKYVRSRIWFMMLTSAAAEWAARRTAMMSATENAHDLISALTRQANEARQAEITTELTEIVGGVEALKQ
ncbi:F0F1 ATP synthase subunit gamma [Nonomuraea soli]|uniref:ATP synthase gamma chain n=1 Tax=Nonomuraea soli TaxID=1032476 RepID=A0A7W0HNJ4_9ACTN|nr:F0F1 ATP synthase subunit gamma [Nonomuraea soli]MBA2889616.1 F-type H+-transporting ATPase subunit gamma [Nonomuraea soli]